MIDLKLSAYRVYQESGRTVNDDKGVIDDFDFKLLKHK
jgi:hypothetical protein